MSGHVGSRADGSPSTDLEQGAHIAFTNLEAISKADGCGLNDIVEVTTFHIDPENQFGVTWLSGFDFEVIARIPDLLDPIRNFMEQQVNIKGKIALVTGASSGIGAATARKLASEGIIVGLAARRKDRLEELVTEITASGGQTVALQTDVTDPASCKAAADELVARFGRIDILVNNAGLMPLSDIDSLKVEEWQRMVDVNVSGVLNATAAVLPQMIQQHSGHIFNMSSIAGRKVFTGLTVYGATKAAVASFSDGLRMELGPKHNIRVTCIQPGAVKSELYDHITDDEYRKQMDDLAAKMTYLEGEDIADTILFALKAPERMNVAEMFVLPTEQGW